MDTNTELTPEKVLRAWEDEDGEPEGYLLVKAGEWEDEGKYQLRTTIVQDIESGRFFAIHDNRSGPYWSVYDYGDSECNEVWPVTVTRTEYVAKRPDVPA